MKIKIHKENFKGLTTAVLYNFYKFIPENSIPGLEYLFKSDYIMYQASTLKTGFGNFNEYSQQFKVSKDFEDNITLNYLNNKSRELIGTDIVDLEKIERTLFPTLDFSEETSRNLNYFGGNQLSGQSLLQINVPSNYWKIELYESNIYGNLGDDFIDYDYLESIGKNTISPSITIYLGPESNYTNNSDDMYVFGDTVNKDITLSQNEYEKLKDEVINQLVLELISSNEDITKLSVNLSLVSWNLSSESNRNMKTWLVRNDDYLSSRNNVNLIEQVDEIMVDIPSNTIVGTTLDDSPIFNSKLEYLTKLLRYFPTKTYKLGDIIEYQGNYWESLKNNNRNNDPLFSNAWILQGELESIFTDQIKLTVNSPISGNILPNGNVTVNFSNPEPITIEVYENIGYTLDINYPCSYEDGQYLESSDYTISIDNVGKKTITITNLNKVIESRKLIINYLESPSIINLESSYKNSLYPYENWNQIDDSFVIKNYYLNGVITEIPNIPITINPYDSFKFDFPSLPKVEIKNITKRYLKDYNVVEEILEVNEVGDFITMNSELVEFSSANYILNLIDKSLTIEVIKSIDIILSDNSIKSVDYNENYTISFYSEKDKSIEIDLINDRSELVISLGDLNVGELINIPESNTTILLNKLESIYNLTLKNVGEDYKIILN